jgi:hypothetical protein
MKPRFLNFFSLLFISLTGYCQNVDFIAAQNLANTYISSSNFTIDSKYNVITDANGVIHIFIFEDGNLLIQGFPTTATQKSKFQVHLYVKSSNADSYLVDYIGNYIPSFNVQGTNGNVIASAGPGASPPPQRIDFAVAGPFTGNLVITLKHLTNGNYNTLVSATIKIAKTIYASIGTGAVFTTLENPTNIKTLSLPSGDTTLNADDKNGRALLTIMATFYPWGRNDLLLPSWQFKDRFGIVVGTSIANGTSHFSDMFFGGQYDFAIGGSIVTGLHYGRVQKISGIDLKHFSFGTSKFTGDLESKKYMTWLPGFFLGLQIDSRIFSQLFSHN